MLSALGMTSQVTIAKREDGRLWAAAFGLSLLCNAVLLLLAGFTVIESRQFQHLNTVAAAPAETVQIIVPEAPAEATSPDAAAAEPAAEAAPEVPVPAHDGGFARTSDDQRGKRPDKPAFIGERDTEATSDATPDPSAPAMPAQAGIQPRHPGDIETTESRYQDGELIDSTMPAAEPLSASPPVPEIPPAPPASAARGETTTTPGPNEKSAPPPVAEHLAEGPNPVDVPVPPDRSEDTPKPEKRSLPREGVQTDVPATDDLKETPAKPVPETTPKQTPFRGNQHKTTIQGSISRTGRSALDVEDSPLGRYQATISRAVELEWQRNCVRYRDFITPGYLTVRFFVDAKGKVRNVQFVGAMQTGQHQKGFTLNSIRDAAIPPMPADVRKDFEDEPLELIFNFYF